MVDYDGAGVSWSSFFVHFGVGMGSFAHRFVSRVFTLAAHAGASSVGLALLVGVGLDSVGGATNATKRNIATRVFGKTDMSQ